MYLGRDNNNSGGLAEMAIVFLMIAVCFICVTALVATIVSGEPFAAINTETYRCLLENGYLPMCLQ